MLADKNGLQPGMRYSGTSAYRRTGSGTPGRSFPLRLLSRSGVEQAETREATTVRWRRFPLCLSKVSHHPVALTEDYAEVIKQRSQRVFENTCIVVLSQVVPEKKGVVVGAPHRAGLNK